MPSPDHEPQPFIIEEYVRWSDVDFAGIIFYGSYVRLFEIAETEMFRHCGLAYGSMFDQYDIVLPRKAVHSEFCWQVATARVAPSSRCCSMQPSPFHRATRSGFRFRRRRIAARTDGRCCSRP